MRKLLTILLLMISQLGISQYPIIEEFDSFGGAGEWTVNNGAGVQNYGFAENYGTFNIGNIPYPNSTTITMESPVYYFSDCATDITISFPIFGIVENGFDFFRFQYFDGGVWTTTLVLTGFQNINYINTVVPNTTTRFRFQLITNISYPVFFRSNLNSYQLTSNATYNIPVDLSNQYIGGAPKAIQVYYYDIQNFTINCSSVLPIELISFDCDTDDDIVNLKWTTASEINNDYFIIEHSTDGYEWNEIGEVEGAGNSTQVIDYNLTHKSPSDGINYYRLTQYDFDGKSESSNVVTCNKLTKEIESVVYYNSLGQLVDGNTLGLVMVMTKYIDGTSKVEKIYRTFNHK